MSAGRLVTWVRPATSSVADDRDRVVEAVVGLEGRGAQSIGVGRQLALPIVAADHLVADLAVRADQIGAHALIQGDRHVRGRRQLEAPLVGHALGALFRLAPLEVLRLVEREIVRPVAFDRRRLLDPLQQRHDLGIDRLRQDHQAVAAGLEIHGEHRPAHSAR